MPDYKQIEIDRLKAISIEQWDKELAIMQDEYDEEVYQGYRPPIGSLEWVQENLDDDERYNFDGEDD